MIGLDGDKSIGELLAEIEAVEAKKLKVDDTTRRLPYLQVFAAFDSSLKGINQNFAATVREEVTEEGCSYLLVDVYTNTFPGIIGTWRIASRKNEEGRTIGMLAVNPEVLEQEVKQALINRLAKKRVSV